MISVKNNVFKKVRFTFNFKKSISGLFENAIFLNRRTKHTDFCILCLKTFVFSAQSQGKRYSLKKLSF
jgi:hypothetical protein